MKRYHQRREATITIAFAMVDRRYPCASKWLNAATSLLSRQPGSSEDTA
jgi:hypothetical protein